MEEEFSEPCSIIDFRSLEIRAILRPLLIDRSTMFENVNCACLECLFPHGN